MEWKNPNEEPIKPQRTPMLWVLALCTMISAGINGLNFLVYMLFPNILQQAVTAMEGMPMFNNEQVSAVFELYLSMKTWQYGLLILAEASLFVGALLMLWKLNAKGFHCYVIGQMALFCLQNFVIGGSLAMNWSAIFWTVTLILLYAMQLRYMKPSNEPLDEEMNSEDENFEQEDQNENN